MFNVSNTFNQSKQMKPRIFNSLILVLFLLTANRATAETLHKLAGENPTSFTIVYDSKAEAEEGQLAAANINRYFGTCMGKRCTVMSDKDFKKGNAIYLTHSNPKRNPFEYTIDVTHNTITIDAGGCWAMQSAGKWLAETLRNKDIPSRFHKEGSVEGHTLFGRPRDVNLRILDDNIWDYSAERLPIEWEKAGIDCRDDHRAPQFAQLVRAYMPDVLCLQEYSKHMHDRFYPLIQKYNYVISHEGETPAWNNTPIFYNKENVEQIESKYNLFVPEKWCNSKTKSFTTAVFRQKNTGKMFGVVSTHLWWKDDSVQAGSTLARAAQVRLIMADVEELKEKYHCPFFVMGDMNSEENTIPIQQFLQYGYKECYAEATTYGNLDNGHHQCFPYEIGVRRSLRKGSGRKVGAIDHCLIYNADNNVEIKVFDCIQPYFTVLLTDHYPNLIDAVMK